MKKRIVLLLSVGLMAAWLWGCGGQEAEEPQEPAAEETTEEEEAEEAKPAEEETEAESETAEEATDAETEAESETETEDPETAAAKAKAYDKAVAMIEKIQAGEEFAAASEEVDPDATCSTMTFGESDGQEALLEATDGLADGTLVEEPVETDSGYYVVYLETQLDREATDAEKEQIVEQRKQDQISELYTQWQEDSERRKNKKNIYPIRVYKEWERTHKASPTFFRPPVSMLFSVRSPFTNSSFLMLHSFFQYIFIGRPHSPLSLEVGPEARLTFI